MRKDNEEFENLYDKLVSPASPAESVAGELLRAAGRIVYRYYNDGDRVGVGYGKNTCNAAARYLLALGNKGIKQAVRIIKKTPEVGYEDALLSLQDAVVAYLKEKPQLFEEKNEKDMWEYRKDSDCRW